MATTLVVQNCTTPDLVASRNCWPRCASFRETNTLPRSLPPGNRPSRRVADGLGRRFHLTLY
jgi:hypothetical protein